MINRDSAKKQVMRLASMIGFPRDSKEALEDLVSAVEIADTDQLAAECITVFTTADNSNEVRCPLAPALRSWILQRQGTEAGRRREKCQVCGGNGWIIIKRGGYTAAQECVCRA